MAAQTLLYRLHRKKKHPSSHSSESSEEKGQGGISSLGTISLTVCVVDPVYAMCGWMHLQRDCHGEENHQKGAGGGGGASFVSSKRKHDGSKRRWFVLVDNQLMCFYSNLTLDQPKHAVNCADVMAISVVRVDGRKTLRVVFREPFSGAHMGGDTRAERRPLLESGASSFFNSSKKTATGTTTSNSNNICEWMLSWDVQETRRTKQMWVRKLYRACPQVVDPTLSEASLLHSVGRAELDRRGGYKHGRVPEGLQV
jgi:hypothetical protein